MNVQGVKCPNCGAEVQIGASNCYFCGGGLIWPDVRRDSGEIAQPLLKSDVEDQQTRIGPCLIAAVGISLVTTVADYFGYKAGVPMGAIKDLGISILGLGLFLVIDFIIRAQGLNFAMGFYLDNKDTLSGKVLGLVALVWIFSCIVIIGNAIAVA